MVADYDPQTTANIVYQGVGLGILAGVSMKTLDIMQEGLRQEKKRRRKKGKKQKAWTPPKMVFQDLKLTTPKF